MALHSLLAASVMVSCHQSSPVPAAALLSDPVASPSLILFIPAETGSVPCEHSYEGLGFTHRWYSGVVLTVAEGGPANRAGIQADDVVEGHEVISLRRATT